MPEGSNRPSFAVGVVETRPIAVVFLVAAVVRLIPAAYVAISRDGVVFADDQAYLSLAREFAEGATPSDGLWSSAWSFTYPIGWAMRLIGTTAMVPLVMSALAGALTAAAVAFVVRHVQGARWALAAGLTAALWPSQILWSSLILRDSFMWMALSAVPVVLTWWGGSVRISRLLPASAALVLLLLYISGSRKHTLVVACLALGLALIVTAKRHRALLALLSLLVVAVVPWLVGLGVAGSDLIRGGTAGRQEVLTAATEDGKTTIACVVVPFVYEAPSDGVGWSNDLQCLPSGARMMLLDPLPNQLHKSRSLWPAFAENLIWYPALGLAVVGVVSTYRRRTFTPALTYTVLVWLGSVTMWGLVDRNFGTGYRHRGEFVWCVIVLAAIGAQRLRERRRSTMTA
ncbi:MAG: hypothetical protein O3B66_09735 [Actinomycetota bacterium]|nr:hypothetical protein [Actinomycetota bacterium]